MKRFSQLTDGADLSFGTVKPDGTKLAIFSFTLKDCGFGEITVFAKQGQVYIDAEGMDKEKVMRAFSAMLDSAIWDDEKDPEKHAQYDEATGRRCYQCPGMDKPNPGME